MQTSVEIEDRIMAKPKGRPKKPTGEGTPVRIDSDIVAMAKYLAARKGIAVSELLSDLLRPIIDRDFRKSARDVLGDDEHGTKPKRGDR